MGIPSWRLFIATTFYRQIVHLLQRTISSTKNNSINFYLLLFKTFFERIVSSICHSYHSIMRWIKFLSFETKFNVKSNLWRYNSVYKWMFPSMFWCLCSTAFGERMLHFADSKLYRKIYHLGTLVYVWKNRTSKGI